MKIVIVGQGPRAFPHPDDAEVWVINGPRLPKRWDRLFQLHGLDHIEHKHGPGFLERLADISPPQRLYMTRTYSEPINSWLPRGIPAAERFPLEQVTTNRCARGSLVAGFFPYFTSSFPLVIAFAVLEGATEITLDGVMWSGGPAQWGASEGWAVPCVEYHLGRAAALGVKIVVPPGCGLFAYREFIYGFEGPGAV